MVAEQRSSAQAAIGDPLSYADARPDDLLFFDGNNDGAVDHVNVYIGRGWALDSSNSYGGVSIMRVGDGWYRDHFTHARRVIH
ncbi:MAG: NlpC/P60 family protein [Nocardioidaceae bacterium]